MLNNNYKALDLFLHFYISRNMDKIETIAALAALAHDTRLDVFRLLVEAGPQGVPVGHIGRTLNVPPATLNHHLAQLKAAGLVQCVREGRKLIHSADYARMDAMLTYLTQNCCQGDDCSPLQGKCYD
jgi:DNA-binding transcriptional ArsR family regulator